MPSLRDATPHTERETEDLLVTLITKLAATQPVSAVGLAVAGFVSADRQRVMFAPHLAWRDAAVPERISARVQPAGGDGPRRELRGLGRVPAWRLRRRAIALAHRAGHGDRRRTDRRRPDLPRRPRRRARTGPPDGRPRRPSVPLRQAGVLGAVLLGHGAGRDRARADGRSRCAGAAPAERRRPGRDHRHDGRHRGHRGRSGGAGGDGRTRPLARRRAGPGHRRAGSRGDRGRRWSGRAAGMFLPLAVSEFAGRSPAPGIGRCRGWSWPGSATGPGIIGAALLAAEAAGAPAIGGADRPARPAQTTAPSSQPSPRCRGRRGAARSRRAAGTPRRGSAATAGSRQVGTDGQQPDGVGSRIPPTISSTAPIVRALRAAAAGAVPAG